MPWLRGRSVCGDGGLAGCSRFPSMKGMRQAFSQSFEDQHQPMCLRPRGNWADLRKTIPRWWEAKSLCMRTKFLWERRARSPWAPRGPLGGTGAGGKLAFLSQDDETSPVISAQEERDKLCFSCNMWPPKKKKKRIRKLIICCN